MKRFLTKKPVLIGIICTAVTIGLLTTLLLWPKAPDPYACLNKAQGRIEQNLCRLAILEQNPTDESVWTELLAQYQQYADPLTLYAAQQKAQEALGHPLLAAPGITPSPAVSVPLAEGSTLAQQGILLKDFDRGDGLAVSGPITYLSAADGIYACYKGLEIKLAGVKAQVMIPAQEGLYFLNLAEHKVQYISGDGLWLTTLSTLPTVDFAFCQGALYQLDPAGNLYRDGQPLDRPALHEICTLGDTLYGLGPEGLYRVEDAQRLVTSPRSGLTAGEDGCLYYLNEYRYPCRYDPQQQEGVILKEQEVTAVGQTGDRVYILTEKGILKKL